MKSIEEVARDLAVAHRREDPATKEIFFLRPSGRVDEVRLVEVSGSADSAGEVLPFRFGPNATEGVPYASVVILLSPEDWERVKRGDLELPEGWNRDDLHPIQ